LNERTSIPFVFIFADLDNFKTVNDQYGHEMGDKVLCRFSEIAKSTLRGNDIIARYGGDEFVMILADTSLENAGAVLARIKTDFGQWVSKGGLQVGVSFGMATNLAGRNNLNNILRIVDEALYEEKRKKGHSR